LEHGAAGEKMQPLFGEFGLGFLRAEELTGGTEPIEPGGVFGAELFREFLAEALSEGGAFAVRGDGDLEIAALDDGAIVEVAVGDVVNGVAEDVAGFGLLEDGGVDFGDGSGGDNEEGAGEIAGFVEFGRPVEIVGADLGVEMGIEARGDDANAGAGFEEGGEFGLGERTTADDDDLAVLEFEECGEEGHGRWGSGVESSKLRVERKRKEKITQRRRVRRGSTEEEKTRKLITKNTESTKEKRRGIPRFARNDVSGRVEVLVPRSLHPGEPHGAHKRRCGPHTARPFGRDDRLCAKEEGVAPTALGKIVGTGTQPLRAGLTSCAPPALVGR